MSKKKPIAPPASEPLQIAPIQSELLKFDPQNPRFYRLVDGTSDSTVIEEMLDDEGVQALMKSIGHQGYFPGEPLLVAPDADGKYIVVEGNRRLAAVKLLNGELAPPPRKSRSVVLLREDAPHQPKELPCIIYPKRADVLRYLGYRHITGIKEWDALSKARYLVELRETFYADKPAEEQLRILSKEIGSRPDVVAQLLTGLTLFERAIEKKFFKKNNLNPDTIDFSYITTALSYNNISDWLKLNGRTDIEAENLNEENLESLFHWMFVPLPGGKTLLRETRRLKQLAAVVNSPDSLRVLVKTGDLDDAYLYTDGPQLALSAALQKADSKLKIVWEMLLSGQPNVEHKMAAEEIALMANRILDQMTIALSTQDTKSK